MWNYHVDAVMWLFHTEIYLQKANVAKRFKVVKVMMLNYKMFFRGPTLELSQGPLSLHRTLSLFKKSCLSIYIELLILNSWYWISTSLFVSKQMFYKQRFSPSVGTRIRPERRDLTSLTGLWFKYIYRETDRQICSLYWWGLWLKSRSPQSNWKWN